LIKNYRKSLERGEKRNKLLEKDDALEPMTKRVTRLKRVCNISKYLKKEAWK
jgi:hypothetical protein